MLGFNSLPKGISLIGRELIQICIGNNEVILNFYPDGRITIFSVESFKGKNDLSFDARGIFSAIGQTIDEFKIFNDSQAAIIMSNQINITLEDENERYESVTLDFEGKHYIV